MVNKKEVKLNPKLRFPEFKDDWTIRKIGDFVEERKDTAGQDLPLYSLTIENGIVPKSKRYERSFLVKGKEDAYKEMLPGDFAFNPMNLRFGALAMHKGDLNVAVSKYYNIFYCNNEGNPDYLESYFTCYNMIGYYNRMSTGTLEEKKRVHYLDFVHFKKPFPTLPEQEKIASFLSAVDKKIQQLTARKELLERYKKGVMQRVFSQQIRFTDDNGKDYPDWEKKDFGEMVKKTKTKYNPVTDDGDFPCIEMESIAKENGILLEVFSSKKQKSIKNKFKNGDILFGKLRPNLKKYLVAPFDGVCSSEIWVLTGINVLNDYLFALIQTNRFYRISNVTSGSKMPRSDWDYISTSPFTFPTIPEQQKISSFLSNIDKKIESVRSQLTQTQTFKKGLLQQLFI